ncbi:MAG: ComF family protein [Lachnospiraceae bacterium]|nr:ComF family protein [Lachnospiraceae bacterium]
MKKMICKTIINKALETIYPPRCALCDDIVYDGRDICFECEKKMKLPGDAVCLKCGKTLYDRGREYCKRCEKGESYFVQGKIIFEYEGDIKESIYHFKYGNRREYAAFYARIANEVYGDWIERKGVELIVPVPMHKKKKRYRGYNQAEIFAKELSKLTDIRCNDVVLRLKNTKPQAKLNQEERKNNLLNAFKIKSDIVKYKKILVIDDIFTTGSTINEIAKELLDAGAKEVYMLCIASRRDV